MFRQIPTSRLKGIILREALLSDEALLREVEAEALREDEVFLREVEAEAP